MAKARTLLIHAALMACLAGCQESTTPREGGLVRLVLDPSGSVLDGESLDVEAFYRRADQSEVPLESLHFSLTSETQQIPVTIDITNCLNDAERDGGGSTCPLRLRLLLRSSAGSTIDVVVIGPLNAGPGSELSPPQVALRRIGSLVLTPTLDSIAVSGTRAIAAEVRTPSGAAVPGQTVLWRSDNPLIASVSTAGVVTGVSPGSAIITAQVAADTTVAATATIVVRGVLGVALSPDSVVLDLNQTLSPIPVVTVVGGVATTVTWSTSNSVAATVSAVGLVTTVGPGSAAIRATSTVDPSKRDSIVVVVAGVQATQARFGSAGSAFGHAIDGNASGQQTEGQILVSGMMADEWFHSGTFSTRQEYDRRTISSNNLTLTQVFQALQTAVLTAEAALVDLRVWSPSPATDTRITTAHILAGMIYLQAAMNYCSGIPFAGTVLGQTQYGPQLGTTAMLDAAIARFDSALAGDPGNNTHVVARLLKARALVLKGQFAAATALTGTVPTAFRSLIGHGPPLVSENAIFHLHRIQKRWSLAHGEGGVGLPFRGGAGNDPAQADPRIPWVAEGIGFDFSSPAFGWLGVTSVSTAQAIAKGEEARLIEAEAALQANDVATFLALINSLRAPAGLPPLTDPGSGLARVNLLFSERGFWLYGTGVRLSDLRRLVRQYGRAPNTVFPSGAYPKGGLYGTDVNLPLPDGFVAGSCFDRNP